MDRGNQRPMTGNEDLAARSSWLQPLWSVVWRSLLVQTLLLVAVAMGLWWLAPGSLGPATAGGMIALLANLAFGIVALGGRRGAGAVMAAFLVAEVVKLVVIILGFALVFGLFADRFGGPNALPLIGTFGLMLGAQWLAPLISGAGRPRRRC